MSETDKMKVDATELARKIASELMSEQTKFFIEEMKKMQDEMSKMKEELSKKVDDALSGKNDGNRSYIGGDKENSEGRGIYSSTSFDYGQLTKGPIEIVEVGVFIPTDEDREITLEEAYNLHQNAQAVSMLISSLSQDEFNKVNGVESAKAIWDILKVSFEGDSSVGKGNIELLQGELERFVFLQGETTQALFDRLMALVNRIRALGSKEWDDNRVARKMLRTYRAKNNMLASMIMERPRYNKSAAINATQQHESKSSSQEKNKVKVDSSSEEESDEEVALVIRNLRRFMKKKSNRKTYGDDKKRFKKRFCYGCGDIGHFIADCPKEKKKGKYNKDDDKKNKKKSRGEAHIGEEWESNDNSGDSSDDDKKKKKKGAANIAIHDSSSSTTLLQHGFITKVLRRPSFITKALLQPHQQ
ncbi:uncharacterized protein [Miscanthus floridulus]|uniref:uncharacterized protein n=1 Tax=Miscanthus floridulus TaxID=154761 RepID=UPI0034575A12